MRSHVQCDSMMTHHSKQLQGHAWRPWHRSTGANSIEIMYHPTGLPKPGEAIDFNGYDTGYADTGFAAQSTVTINYKFHDKLHPIDLTPIDIPLELFEGPALRCQELFLKDLRQEFSDMEVHERQLEFWTVRV